VSASGTEPAASPPRPLLVYALTLAGMLTTSLMVPVVPDVISSDHLSPDAAGWLLAAGTAPGIPAAPLLGLLAVRIGVKRVVTACVLLVAVPGTLFLARPPFDLLLVIRVLQGVGSVGLMGMALTLVARHWSGAARARVLARNAAVLSAIAALAPALGGVIGTLLGWPGLGLVYAAALLLAPWALRLGPTAPPPSPAPQPAGAAAPVAGPPPAAGLPPSSLAAARRKALRRGTAAVLGAGAVGFCAYFGLLQELVPVVALQRLSAGDALRGVIIGLAAIPSTAFALLTARIPALPARVVVTIGFAGYAAACALAALASSVAALIAAVLVLGAASGFMTPTLQRRMSELADQSSGGATMAAWTGTVRLGQTIGPAGAAYAFTAAGAAATLYALAGGLAVAACAALLGALAFQPGASQNAPGEPAAPPAVSRNL
jgi:MFS family permease